MISFIVPIYNKGSILYEMLTSLFLNLKKHDITDFEVIVINDGSTDNSFEEAVRFKRFNGDTHKIKIYHYSQNVGKGFALKYGFSKSTGDPIVFLDGDMDIDTRQVINALKTHATQNADMVIGSKYTAQSRTHYPKIRYVYSLILKYVITVLFHLSVSDTQVGLKVFRRAVLAEVFPRLIIKRFAVDLELLIVAQMYGFIKVTEIPVVINHTHASNSTIDIHAVKNFCQDIAALWYRKNILHFYDDHPLVSSVSYLQIEMA